MNPYVKMFKYYEGLNHDPKGTEEPLIVRNRFVQVGVLHEVLFVRAGDKYTYEVLDLQMYPSWQDMYDDDIMRVDSFLNRMYKGYKWFKTLEDACEHVSDLYNIEVTPAMVRKWGKEELL